MDGRTFRNPLDTVSPSAWVRRGAADTAEAVLGLRRPKVDLARGTGAKLVRLSDEGRSVEAHDRITAKLGSW